MKRVILYLSFLILLLPSCNPNNNNGTIFGKNMWLSMVALSL